MSSSFNLTSQLYDTKFFKFEQLIDFKDEKEWLINHWDVSFIISLVYILFVLTAQQWMRNKPKMDLTLALFIWNLTLATFSIIGAVRGVPNAIRGIKHFGFKYSVCENNLYVESPAGLFWGVAFAVSKVLELGDTAFIVLRKQNLSFLHWYHHVTVLIYVWYSYSQQSASGGLFGSVNITVHAFMYTYYAFKSLKFRVPRPIAMFITIFQLVQMMVGCYINYTAYHVLKNGGRCSVTMDNIKYSSLMYFSYLLLFFHFFLRAYVTGQPLMKKRREDKSA